MAANDKVQLKERVEEFLEQQETFDRTQPISVVCDDSLYFILYGTDLQSGIAGFGETPDRAFKEFKNNWVRYRTVKE